MNDLERPFTEVLGMALSMFSISVHFKKSRNIVMRVSIMMKTKKVVVPETEKLSGEIVELLCKFGLVIC